MDTYKLFSLSPLVVFTEWIPMSCSLSISCIHRMDTYELFYLSISCIHRMDTYELFYLSTSFIHRMDTYELFYLSTSCIHRMDTYELFYLSIRCIHRKSSGGTLKSSPGKSVEYINHISIHLLCQE